MSYWKLTPVVPLRLGLLDMTVRVRIAYGAIAATYLATILSILFGCHPMHKNWQINPDPGSIEHLQ